MTELIDLNVALAKLKHLKLIEMEMDQMRAENERLREKYSELWAQFDTVRAENIRLMDENRFLRESCTNRRALEQAEKRREEEGLRLRVVRVPTTWEEE